MHDHDEQGAREHIGGHGRGTPRWSGALVLLGLLLGGASEAQASSRPVHPLGQCVGGKVVAGQGYSPLQGYDVVNTWVGRCASTTATPPGLGLACKHAGIDIQQTGDETGVTVNDPVYAMADGRVLDLISWGGASGEGEGVLVGHEDGSVAHYVHLAQVYVGRGQVVRQGQPLGRLMDYPYSGEDNDHLHLEYRRALDPTVRACVNAEGRKDCADETDFSWECKGNGYVLDDANATASAIDPSTYGYLDPNAGLRTGVETPEILDWTPPTDAPLVDLRFNPDDATLVNYGAPGGSAAGSAEIKRPYEDESADFCDYQGRLEAGGGLTYAATDTTSFTAGVVFDVELELDPITSTEWVDLLRGGDADETTWRLVARYNEGAGTHELGLQVTVAGTADAGDPGASDDATTSGGATSTGAPDEAPAGSTVLEVVGTLSEPQCQGPSTPTICAPATDCPAAPSSCDPAAGVPMHCFSDFGYRQWRHVAGRYDDANETFELRLDGELFASGVVGGPLQPPSDTVTVYVGGGMGMKVDDVRVWDPSSVDGDKGDEVFDPFGDAPRGMEDGCQCSTGAGAGAATGAATGAGGSLLLLLGLWGLRRRRSA